MKIIFPSTKLIALAILSSGLTSPLLAETFLIERFSNELTSSGLQVDSSPPSNLGTFDIVINPGPTLAGNAPALAAFNRAAQLWEGYIADSITVNIDADLGALGPGVLGSASSTALASSYDTIRNQMVLDAVDEADDGIVASLPTSAQFSSTLDGGIAGNGGNVTWDGNLSANSASLKALGFTVPAGADATITFSTSFAFDFDNSDGVTPGQTDFETVAAHEIGHALGWTSNIDTIDAMMDPGVDGIAAGAVSIRTMDLFRFADGTANDPSSALDFSTSQRNLTPGVATVFDEVTQQGIPGAEALLSTGRTQGDGQQASHLKADELNGGLNLGILDPTLAPGVAFQITSTDLRVLDLIGYEILAPVPEPSVSLLLLTGFSSLVFRRRRS